MRRYGLDSARVPWRWLAPGVRYFPLALSPGATGDLRLLKIAPGRKMPEHGHGGCEMTLVLDGAYSDETGIFRRGDIQDVDGELEHQPIVGKRARLHLPRRGRTAGALQGRIQPAVAAMDGHVSACSADDATGCAP